ncbi:MAG: potassium-transporting ATPase subunit F [Actinobacteria bacterium]|nr:potassium-transporting ATPase subunit F [Actinomycetota bacterium]
MPVSTAVAIAAYLIIALLFPEAL